MGSIKTVHSLILKLDAWIRGSSFWAKTLSALFLVGLIAWLDYATGEEVSVSLFYLLPVLFSAWFLGDLAALIVSLLCAVATAVTDILGGSALPIQVMAWNAFISFGIYATLAWFARTLQRVLDKESRLARTDPLTGAANLRSFMEALDAEIERSRRYEHPFVLAYFDMDRFKEVNDARGHTAGDELLRQIAHLVRSKVRNTDLLARMGGDEFAVLMPETDAAAGEAAIRKVREALNNVALNERTRVSFSVGVLACESKLQCSAEDLLNCVDELMYEAKRGAGRDSRDVDSARRDLSLEIENRKREPAPRLTPPWVCVALHYSISKVTVMLDLTLIVPGARGPSASALPPGACWTTF